jgi:hypothetical protein
VVASASFPSWLPLLKSLGYQPILILTHDPSALPLIEVFTPKTCTVWCSRDWKQFIPDQELRSTKLLVVFADVRLGLHKFSLFEALEIQWIATTWPVRGNPSKWHEIRIQATHSDVGGVSAQHTRMSLWRPLHLPPVIARKVGTRIPRDASTVLSATGFARGTRKAPRITRVFPLSQENLGSQEAPIWHSGGLLPAVITRATRVLLPCLGLPPGMWGIRRLSLSEIFHSLDFNDVL